MKSVTHLLDEYNCYTVDVSVVPEIFPGKRKRIANRAVSFTLEISVHKVFSAVHDPS
jgi:hypothetical protein